MAVYSTHLNSFTGGLVSTSCLSRPDMEQFGKWFYRADNIRYDIIGSFCGRYGFKHISQCLNIGKKEPVKLLSFNFSREESFLIELGSGYFRVFKNGKPVLDYDDKPKKFVSLIDSISDLTIKYVQIGDVLFVSTKKYPLMEIRRYDKEGNRWEMVESDIRFPPLLEQNTDSAYNISLLSTEVLSPMVIKTVGSFANLENSQIKNFQIKLYSKTNYLGVVYSTTEISDINQIISNTNSSEGFSKYNETLSYNSSSRTFVLTPNAQTSSAISKAIIEVTIVSSVGFQRNFIYSGERTISGNEYEATASFNFFSDKAIGESFALRNNIDAKSISISITGTTGDSSSILSNGKYRVVTSGNWKGSLKVQYSEDNGKTWNTARTIISSSTESPYNENFSDEISSEDLVLLRFSYEITSGTCNMFMESSSYEIISYYKINSITDERTARVSATRGDVGAVENNYKYYESAFSENKGFSEAVSFFQNRLVLSKDYYLFTSKSNDFWDFKLNADLADDDPITMSLLSSKINNIKNILTIRDFFAFTNSGEFSISSQGALTQSDKFLNPLSYNGSNDCDCLLVGNIVLFVDSSENKIRALKYTLESDGYEATDVSFQIEDFLDGKTIIRTAFLSDKKECLFLTSDGDIFVYKFFPEQNISAWSIWKHSKYKIVDMTVVQEKSKDILYIVTDNGQHYNIERFDENAFSDSQKDYEFEEEALQIEINAQKGTKIAVSDEKGKYVTEIEENGILSLLRPSKKISAGFLYTVDAVLFPPKQSAQDGSSTIYNVQKPFKVFFVCKKSYGFEIGCLNEKMYSPDLQPFYSTKDDETNLITGKGEIVIQAGYNRNNMVRFLQEKPYPIKIENICAEVDYGGK